MKTTLSGLSLRFCPICGKHHEVPSETEYDVVGTDTTTEDVKYTMCAEHQKLFDIGYIALVGIIIDTNPEFLLTPYTAKRTGKLIHVKESELRQRFNPAFYANAFKIAFAEDSLIEYFISKDRHQGKLH